MHIRRRDIVKTTSIIQPGLIMAKKVENVICPECGNQGKPVKNITVQHLVLDEVRNDVGSLDYYLCMSEVCDVTYFNPNSLKRFYKNQLSVPIWFKNEANPKYACYCSRVTEQEVIDAVAKQGATTMKEVLVITGAMKNSQCQRKNPLGICCHQIILDAMGKGKAAI